MSNWLRRTELIKSKASKRVPTLSNTDGAFSTFIQDDDDYFPSVEELLSPYRSPVADCAGKMHNFVYGTGSDRFPETANPNDISDCNFLADTHTSSPSPLHGPIDHDDDDRQTEEEDNNGSLHSTHHDISTRHRPSPSCKTVHPAPRRRSRYTKAEDERFVQLKDRGILNWEEIEDFFPERSPASLRKRYGENWKSGSCRSGRASSPVTSAPTSSVPAVSPVTAGLAAPESSRPAVSPESVEDIQDDHGSSNGVESDALRRSTRKRKAPTKYEGA